VAFARARCRGSTHRAPAWGEMAGGGEAPVLTVADLPEGVGLRVLGQLPPEALAAASMACRSWRRLGGDALLWRRHCEAAGFVGAAMGRPAAAAVGPASSQEGSRLKEEFGRRWIWRRRWLAGRWRSLCLKAHTDWVISVGLLRWPRSIAERAVAAPGPKWTEDLVRWCGERSVAGPGGGNASAPGGGDGLEGAERAQDALEAAAAADTPLEDLENFIVSIGDEQECYLWDLRDGKCLGDLPCPDAASMLPERPEAAGSQGAFDFSDEVLCQVGPDGRTLEMWDSDGALLGELEGHTRRVDVVEIGPRNLVASGGKDACLRVWRAEHSRPCLHYAADVSASVKCILWRSTDSLVAGLYDGRLVHLDPLGRQELGGLRAHAGPVLCIQALESWAVSGSRDGSVVVTCPDTLEPLFRLEGHTGPVCCLFCSPSCVVSGSKDQTVRVWKVQSAASPPEREQQPQDQQPQDQQPQDQQPQDQQSQDQGAVGGGRPGGAASRRPTGSGSRTPGRSAPLTSD